jgi:hypothetical protein
MDCKVEGVIRVFIVKPGTYDTPSNVLVTAANALYYPSFIY